MKKYIIDIDGTLLDSGNEIEGASEFIKHLQMNGTEFLLATNSVKTKSLQISRLARAGIEVSESQIFSPINSINQHISKNEFDNVYTIGSEKEINQIEANQDNVNPQLIILLDFEKTNVPYMELQKLIHLVEEGCPIITASRSSYYLVNGKKTIDTGAYVALIESIINNEIGVFGKPSTYYFKYALEKFNETDSETWMIGDDWQTDIIGAKKSGLNTILVKTGKYKKGDELKSSPNYLVENLSEVEF